MIHPFPQKEKINVAVVGGVLTACSTEVSVEDLHAGSICAVAEPASAQNNQAEVLNGGSATHVVIYL